MIQEDRFGMTVSETIATLSERRVDADGNKRKWEVHKQETLQHLRKASLETLAVKQVGDE